MSAAGQLKRAAMGRRFTKSAAAGLDSNFIRFGKRSFYPQQSRTSFGNRSYLSRAVDASAAAVDAFGRGSRGHPSPWSSSSSSSGQSAIRRKLMSNFIRFGRRADYNANNKPTSTAITSSSSSSSSSSPTTAASATA